MIDTFPFNSIKPSGFSSYSRMFIWYIEVREWLSNLHGLASQERKEVKGIVISCWNFFFGGRWVLHLFPQVFWLMGLSFESWEWDQSWPMQKEEGRSGLGWWFRHKSLCVLRLIRSKQASFFWVLIKNIDFLYFYALCTLCACYVVSGWIQQ